MEVTPHEESLKFLGTAGARIVVSKQLRASGGLWMSLHRTNILLDPGPGTLVKCHTSKPKLDPTLLDAIIISHRHIDHSNDANVMIEAMTEGGYKKKGVVFAPRDALEGEPVIFSHVRSFVNSVQILEERRTYHIGDLAFETSPRHRHGVETYGFKFRCVCGVLCIIPDTHFFPGLLEFYRGDILIMNVVRRYRKDSEDIDHLNADDARDIIAAIKPKAVILTHFGMTMLRAKPWEVAAQIQSDTGIKTIAASDGLHLNLRDLSAP